MLFGIRFQSVNVPQQFGISSDKVWLGTQNGSTNARSQIDGSFWRTTVRRITTVALMNRVILKKNT